MGYACPVCGDPQADGEHLANHLAFTAMLGDADHEDWLDEHAPDWGDTDPAELAARVTDHAEEREFPQVFEDTTGGDQGHEHDHGHGDPAPGRGDVSDPRSEGDGRSAGVSGGVAPGGETDPAELFDADRDDRDPSEVLAEARELTQARRSNAGADGDSADSGGDETAATDGEDGDADEGR